MHIKDMTGLFQRSASRKLEELKHRRLLSPVALEVVLETPVSKPQQLVDGVKRIKETPWYRVLRKRGLHFVPIGYREGVIVLVVGTAASLGAAYIAYKRIKGRQQRRGPS
jgi:hypothetical protein